jgi:drug/metabolite transporter (DMT)-like permease
LLAIFLALAASLSWGAGDFLGGISARSVRLLTVLAVSQVSGLAVVAIVLLVGRPSLPPAGSIFAAMAGGIGGAVGLAALYRGLAVGVMGVVAPISGVAAVIPFAVGVASGDRPRALQLVGVALALAGVALVSREPVKSGARRAAGVGLAVLAACGFGAYFVGVDAAADDGVAWAVFASRGTAAVLCVAGALVVGAGLNPGQRFLPVIALVGLFDVGANFLFSAATTRGLVSVVSVLASLYPVVTVALARVFLHERLARTQWAGASFAIGGATLITAG